MRLPLTPLDFYRRSRQLLGGKVGIVDGSRHLSFGEFADRVERLAGALRAWGLKPREPVSVLSANTHHVLEAFYGAPLAGGLVHPERTIATHYYTPPPLISISSGTGPGETRCGPRRPRRRDGRLR